MNALAEGVVGDRQVDIGRLVCRHRLTHHVVALADEPGGQQLGGHGRPDVDEDARHHATEAPIAPAVIPNIDEGQDEERPSSRILVVDDHELFAELMVHALRLAGFDDAACVDPRTLDLESILARAVDFRPDVVLLDLLLGRVGTSTHYIGPLRQLGAAVLVLTASEDAALLAECVEAGAAGVFSKGCPFAELLEVLTDAVRGETVLSPTARVELLDALHRRRSDDRARLERFAALAPRESAVLQALIDGRQAEEIANIAGVSVSTVRAQIRSVLQKLGVNSQLAAVALARRAGWPEKE